jgi:hypothetical protein
MAEGKKAFVLYTDLIHTVKKMPMDKRGELLTIILEYVNDLNPTTEDLLVDLVFEPIKRQMKRDLVKYEDRAGRSRENGKLGGRPPKPKETQDNPKEPSGLNDNPDEPKEPDTVTVTVTDTVIVKDSKEKEFVLFWDLYNKKVGIKKAKEKFLKLSPETIEKILKAVPKYLQSDNVKKGFKKDPTTWLNGEHWNDEVGATKPKIDYSFLNDNVI